MVSNLTSGVAKFCQCHNPKLLLFGGGFLLGAVLTASSKLLAHIPISVAFGLLCFGCGIVLVQSLELQKKRNAAAETFEHFMKLKFDVSDEESKLEKQRESMEEEQERWEGEKEIAIRKAALRLLEGEAARRGGEQIERDMDS
jgi:hypothetical protein